MADDLNTALARERIADFYRDADPRRLAIFMATRRRRQRGRVIARHRIG